MFVKRNQYNKNSRGHNITFLSGFPADYSDSRLHEITPAGLSEYIQNYTNWDLVGLRMDGKLPYSVWDVIRFAFEVFYQTMYTYRKISSHYRLNDVYNLYFAVL